MDLGDQFKQPQIPFWNEGTPTTPKQTESAWDKAYKASRESLVQHNLSGSSYWEFNKLGGYKSQVSRSESGRKYDPTKSVSNLVRLTNIPDKDIVDAQGTSVTIGGTAPRGGGSRAIRSGNIYVSKGSAEHKRAVVTHELAHTLQSTLTDTQADVELHKYGIHKNRKVATRYTMTDDPAMRELEATPMHAAGLPIFEGSAEGYRETYQGPKAAFNSVYSNKYMNKNYGPDAGEAYDTAKSYTERTGRVVPDHKILEGTRLAGVLEEDTVEDVTTGTRSRDYDRDASTVHRMMTHILSPETTVSPHRIEYERRRSAIEGQVVQQSMFPELVPETNQFGSPVWEESELKLSTRGQALREGRQTEMRPEDTRDGQAKSQRAVIQSRRSNPPIRRDDVPGSPSAHTPAGRVLRGRLRRHVAEKEAQEKHRASQVAAQDQASRGELHPEVETWLGKLVYQKKADYARSYATAKQAGNPLPELPTGLKEEHAEKARNSVDKILKKHGIG